eukprot:6213358-Pleurochrysis_carterae.AAC.3
MQVKRHSIYQPRLLGSKYSRRCADSMDKHQMNTNMKCCMPDGFWLDFAVFPATAATADSA